MALNRRKGTGINVRPDRVRQARRDARLSLSQLARGDISRTALHLVETGKSRPSMSTLKLIADRTGKSLEYFLAHEDPRVLSLLAPDLELAIAQGRFVDAQRIGKQLAAAPLDEALQARVSIITADAYLQTASVDAALPLLAQARAILEVTDDKLLLAECLDLQAAAEHLLENPSALALARQALAIAKSANPTSNRTLVRIYGRIGSICVAQHKWQDAVDAYEQAVAAGAGILNMSRLAKMNNDLSIAYRRLGQLERAAEYALKSVAIHEALNDRLSVARAETNLGLVLIRQREHATAGAHLDRALAIFVEADQPRGRSHILLAQAELLVEQNKFSLAKTKAEEASQLAMQLGELATVSEAKQILATIAAAEGNNRVSDALFADAIRLLEGLNLPERLTTVHALYARTLERRGELAAALEQWRLAVGSTHPEAAFDAFGLCERINAIEIA